MGRFASTVEFYARYREPYSAEFFAAVARQLSFSGGEALLDVGCGPGLLALGFARFVGSCTGVDPEPAMLAAAEEVARAAQVALRLIPGRLEDISAGEKFEVITIGRALHWLEREPSLEKLDQLLAPGGRILICGAHIAKSADSPWAGPYDEVRHAFTTESEERYKLKASDWFAASPFAQVEEISVSDRHPITVAELIGRALSRSNTSPQVLGHTRPEFEATLREILQPFEQDGVLHEEIVSRATVFQRVTS